MANAIQALGNNFLARITDPLAEVLLEVNKVPYMGDRCELGGKQI